MTNPEDRANDPARVADEPPHPLVAGYLDAANQYLKEIDEIKANRAKNNE
jgi:hypothetical protein